MLKHQSRFYFFFKLKCDIFYSKKGKNKNRDHTSSFQVRAERVWIPPGRRPLQVLRR